ncbi:uncharacterized protein LOC123307675 isoform X2 [Coccinella septempunctata]|uniref:uncharacterized protein LOC123307675 isoform X2 n=1 Tax=Coccinella septempunctata TaxID=41139 RepID=UPI001D08C573|nr:uncharacterized protein LOC123307675 isoform X2 [Coccinella septempunctata]
MAENTIIEEILTDSDSDSENTDCSTSTSSSVSLEDEINLNIISEHKVRGPIDKIPRIEGYIKNVIGHYTPEIFKQHFRVSPDTYQYLVDCLRETVRHPDDPGRYQTPLEHQVLFALWFFATPDCYRSVCEKFNMGKATGFRIIRRVVKGICELAPNFINWPTNRSDAAVIWDGFREKGPIPKVVGAIDGCHINITKPSEDGNSFINRHHNFSIQLQDETLLDGPTVDI